MPQKIQADMVVQSRMESRGVTTTVGVFGKHKVQIGSAPPINLASIKSNRVPWAGFRTAAKVASGQAGVRRCTRDALTTLNRPGGKLDAKALLGALKANQVHLGRLEALGTIPQSQLKEPSLWAFAPAVEKMSNAELSAVYQSFASAEMDLLQTALEHEGRINPKAADARSVAMQLFGLQALVLKEVSNRVARGENMPGANALPSLSQQFEAEAPAVSSHTHDITHANMSILVEVGAQSATKREKTAENVHQGLIARNLPEMSARKMGDILRSAELTVNMQIQYLLQDIVENPDAPKKNLFHLVAGGTHVQGEGYTAQRDATERLLFPALDGHEVNPNERPTYGALNLLRRKIGAVSLGANYGTAAIVLKPEVARRATYIAEDTFYSPAVNMGTERRKAFYSLLPTLVDKGGITRDFVQKCQNIDSPEHKALEAWFDRIAKVPDATVQLFSQIPTDLLQGRDAMGFFTGLLLNVFGDKEATRQKMATFDNLEALIPNMSTPTANSIARAVQESTNGAVPRLHLSGVQYIEAQVQGPIIPSRDIAEIRIDLADVPLGEQSAIEERLNTFEKATGIRVSLTSYSGTVQEMKEGEEIGVVLETDKKFHMAHLDELRMEETVKRFTSNVQEELRNVMREDSDLQQFLPLFGGRNPLQDNALAKFFRKFNDALDVKRSRPSDKTEQEIVREAFREAAVPLLKLKGELLRELDNLKFDTPEQKAAFTTWVLSAGVLRSPEELRIIHTHATELAKVWVELAGTESELSEQDFFLRMSEFTKTAIKGLDEFITSLNDPDFGTDDRKAEWNRISFMSLALIKHSQNPGNTLNRIQELLTRPEQQRLAEQITSVNPGEHLAGGPLIRATYDIMELSTGNLCRETGRPAPPQNRFFGELSLVPKKTRETLGRVSEAAFQYLNTKHPAYPPFPAPDNPGALPGDDKARRKFLTDHLDVYKVHEQTFERGTSVHGRGHIARTFIFATVMSNILREQGVEVDRTAVLCGISGHDLGRQGGGTDKWEERSAQMTVHAMRQDFGETSMGTSYENAIAESIDAHKGKTLEALLLNAADSLDIGRTTAFDPDRFAFLQGRPGEVRDRDADRVRQQLAKEADLLQRLTNPLCMNRNILDNLAAEMGVHSDDEAVLEKLRSQRTNLLNDIADAFAKEWDVSSVDYMQRIEAVISGNRDLFPLLSKYYQA